MWGERYFARHSEDVDDFGFDPKFNASVLPFFEFLYTMWWRVEVAGHRERPRPRARA